MNLAKWGARVANWKKQGPERPLEYHLCHLHEEVSEVFKALRANPDPAFRWLSAGDKPEGFGPELADVVLVAVFVAEVCGIDLEWEMSEKMSYNEQRRAKK